MNNTMNLNYLTGLSSALSGVSSGGGTAKQAAAQGLNFLDMAARLKAEQAAPAQAGTEGADRSLEAYKQLIWQKISLLPMSASQKMESISIQITDAGFAAMQNDPDYEAWVLEELGKNFLFQNPWTAVCGGGYTVHHFGASKEEYHGESWYSGYMGGQGASLFAEKSEDSFWEQRAERQKQYMELQQKIAARRQMMQRLGLQGSPVSAAELLMCLL